MDVFKIWSDFFNDVCQLPPFLLAFFIRDFALGVDYLAGSWLAIIAAIELSKAFGFALRRNRFPWFFVYLAIWIVCMFNNGDILVKFAAKAAEKNPLWCALPKWPGSEEKFGTAKNSTIGETCLISDDMAEKSCLQFFMVLQLYSHVIVLMAPMDIHGNLYRFLHQMALYDYFHIGSIFITVCNLITILAA